MRYLHIAEALRPCGHNREEYLNCHNFRSFPPHSHYSREIRSILLLILFKTQLTQNSFPFGWLWSQSAAWLSSFLLIKSVSSPISLPFDELVIPWRLKPLVSSHTKSTISFRNLMFIFIIYLRGFFMCHLNSTTSHRQAIITHKRKCTVSKSIVLKRKISDLFVCILIRFKALEFNSDVSNPTGNYH